MSKRYPGGLITKNPNINPTPEGGASGIWTLDQAIFYQQLGTWPSATDPYFNQTTLLLHGDGTNGAQNNTFLDSSTNNFTITRNGNTTQGTFSPFSVADGEWSNYFNGSSALSFEPGSITIGSGTDFCIEAWVYPTNLSAVNGGIFQAGTQDGSLAFRHNTNGTLRVLASAVSSQLDTTTALTNNEWYHIAATRSSGTLRIFINGVEDASTADSTDYTDPSSSNDFVVGGRFYSSAYQDEFYGYISNLRFVVGSAVYTSGFTPSTTPLTDIANTELLTCQSNRFVDNSSNALVGVVGTGNPSVQPFSPFAPSAAYSASVNGGSGYFDGSGDYLSIADNAAFDFGTGDFTIEAFINVSVAPSSGNVYRLYSHQQSGSETVAYLGVINSGGTIYAYAFLRSAGGTGGKAYQGTTAIPVGSWAHIALTRDGTTGRLFTNGSLDVTETSQTQNISASATVYIGTYDTTSELWNGYMSSVRVNKGTALYTSAFTPATAPLTAVSGTSLLLNYTNAGIFDNTGKNNLETVGNAQVDTTTKKYGTGSMEFDGTGDRVTMPNTPLLQLTSTEPFTVELWVYANALASDQHIIHAYNQSSPFQGWALGFGSGGVANTTLAFWDGTTWRTIKTGMSTSTWYHIAITSEGSSSTGRFFVDGVQQGSAVTFASSILNTVTPISLGATPTGNDFNGYIDDLRITKGVARYTANFTPPGGPFQNS